jgi:ABC-type sugar transport system ATPase subunit
MNAISLCRLSKRHGRQVIFSDLSLVLPNKGLVAVIGESGSGKTTLLDIVAGLDVDYEGAVEVLGEKTRKP